MDSKKHLTDPAILSDAAEKLLHFGQQKKNLLPMLQMIQEAYGYLPPETLEMTATHIDAPTCEVYGVATFYNQFRFSPPGKNPIRVCLGTACHVRGGEVILENFERSLDIEEGQTTDDMNFSIERVACLGCCALAPVVTVDETVHGNMAYNKVPLLIDKYRNKKQSIHPSQKDINESGTK
jgi:NADH-quinone oxidoreductase subunit E